MSLNPEIQQNRKAAHPIQPFILNRWSPRSMTGEPLSDEELMSLFEAARWAPSSYNAQPWRFLYAKHGSAEWPLFFNLMIEFNQSWTKNAAVLLVIISTKYFEHNNKPSHTHSFDTGAAWMSLALEANARGLVAHGMEGFDYTKAMKDLEIPDSYQVEAMAAIGKRAPKENLAEDLQKREVPSTRKEVKDFVRQGKFNF